MADVVSVTSIGANLHSGSGQLFGLVLTANAANLLATIYDNTAGSGTKIFEAYVSSTHPLVIFFEDRFAPRFTTGLYISLAVGLTATIWSRQL